MDVGHDQDVGLGKGLETGRSRDTRSPDDRERKRCSQRQSRCYGETGNISEESVEQYARKKSIERER
jgi:hypothetical protein